MTDSQQAYVEEAFGILTDDQLYLDCILVKPAQATDEILKAIRVWVPKHPLTKSSVITCARREVEAYGPDGKIAHLVFDLRGTGNSDGHASDQNFHLDLHAISEWAKERFGRINFGFLGTPNSAGGRVYMWPLRAGTVLESYYYHPAGVRPNPPSILYMSTYGHFDTQDDAHCVALADAGYHVYGFDPLRYLLHASSDKRLTPKDLWADAALLMNMLPSPPIIIGNPLSAGLAMLWASKIKAIRGVIAIGQAKAGFKLKHIFNTSNPYTFLVTRYVPAIPPRPLALVLHTKHPLGGENDEMAALYQNSKDPRRVERTDNISADYLLKLCQWILNKAPA